MELLRRIDRGIARGEAVIASVVLLGMIVIAAAQALLRNLTNTGAVWANEALMHISWADQFLQKGTLWLAFLGASLAVHGDKHIGIDVIARLSKPVVRSIVLGVAGIAAGVICFALAKVFYMSISIIAGDIPMAYEVFLSEGGRGHICDVPVAELVAQGVERPGVFCGLRSLLGALGAPATTPENAMQVIIPPVLVLMGTRFLFKGVGSLIEAARGGATEESPALTDELQKEEG